MAKRLLILQESIINNEKYGMDQLLVKIHVIAFIIVSITMWLKHRDGL